MIAPLAEEGDFRIWRQTRTGLFSYPLDPNAARAHLAASIYLQMALKPHIVHIVGHTEAHHAATAEDIIEASMMAAARSRMRFRGQPDMTATALFEGRKAHLMQEAKSHCKPSRMARIRTSDALTDADSLAEAVKNGILDAPHLKNNPFAAGTIKTRIINGACEAVDVNREIISEEATIGKLS